MLYRRFAGIIRAACPSAHLISVPVMYGDGACDEADLIAALQGLHERHMLSLSGALDEPPLDIVNLSMGFYHEAPDTVSDTAGLNAAIGALSEAGVTIVASAGNGGSDVEFWPAALCTTAPRENCAPLVSVGASNPGSQTVSHFSNTGQWVRTYRPGTAIVSTMPTTFDAAAQSSARARPAAAPVRGTSDVDNYAGGFGIWSGTSFSAPLFAGELAQRLAESTGIAPASSGRSSRARALVDELCEGGGLR